MTRGRSHPPTLLTRTLRLIADEQLWKRGDLVLCACSGGPDSTALLHVLSVLRATVGHELVAHGVDHGLRPEAAKELEQVRALSATLGVPFGVTRVEVGGGPNLQERARRARRHVLAGVASSTGASLIATGHTADDRAETFLLRLLRGAGPRGLAVLPPRARLEPGASIQLVRPLLGSRRADVLAHLRRHGLPWAEDPSNADPRFSRVRVRRELLPLMEEMSPGIVDHLSALADMLQGVEGGEKNKHETLSRAQRLAIERARRLGRRSVQLRVHGGRDVNVTFPNGRIVLSEK